MEIIEKRIMKKIKIFFILLL